MAAMACSKVVSGVDETQIPKKTCHFAYMKRACKKLGHSSNREAKKKYASRVDETQFEFAFWIFCMPQLSPAGLG
jgi:hypothetical protein